MSKFRCPECFRPNVIPQDTSDEEITCAFCNKITALPKPTYPEGHDINGFVIQEWLGNGSLGEIYRANQTAINDRPTALKIVTKEHIRSEEDMERFFREIKIVASLNHKNIATAFIAGKFDDGVYLASSYVDGKTLDDILTDGPLSEDKIISYSKGIVSALKYAWDSRQILHRDLKPTNFMVDSKEQIYLVDMCVAKSLEILSDITMMGDVIGTPYYISPEQASGESELDPKTDMYGLGATMYQMITGNPPFFSEGTKLEISAKKLSTVPGFSDEIKAEYSEELLDIVTNLMSIDKNDRPDNWNDVLEKLDSISEDDDDFTETDEEDPVEVEESSENPQSNTTLIIAAAIVIAVIVGVILSR